MLKNKQLTRKLIAKKLVQDYAMKTLKLTSSFWWFFRPIFILFFLYLMGDAFFRWDGFSYYGSFAEFIPSAALVSILWSAVAVVAVLLALVLDRAREEFCRLTGVRITTHQWLLFTILFILSGITSWIIKRYFLHLGISFQITLIELACALTVGLIITWTFRSRAEQWIDVIQNRITPLVWLYGIWVIVSVPLVAYHVWENPSDTVQSEPLASSYSTTEERPNIILVTFDALSARNMSVYGYHRPTTPFINEWSKKASLFTNLEAAGTFTVLTTASLMTGKRAWSHKVFQLHSFNTLKSDIESLPLMLKKNGYYNIQFNQNQYATAKRLGISNSFDSAPPVYDFWSSNSFHGHVQSVLAGYFEGRIRLHNWIIQGDFILSEVLILTNRYRNNSITDHPPEKVFNKFISHIKDKPDKPFFAWLHLYPPHFPYLSPEPYMGMINPSSELRGRLDQYNVFFDVASYKSGTISLDEIQPQIDILKDRYDEFIMYCDNQFESFITKLEAMDELGNTIVILSSDHGEIFTSAEMGHGGVPREHVTHIPLIIRKTGQSRQNIIGDLVEQVDIPPTILELAGIQVPLWMEGRSFVPLLRGKKLPQKPAFAGDFQSNPSRAQTISRGTVAVWEGDYKLIHDLGKKTSLLFNLKSDPDEQNNLIDTEPAIGQHLLGIVMEKINKANQEINMK